MAFNGYAGEVHSWCVRLDLVPEQTARLHATLSSDERERSARFRFERDRQRFVAAHGQLRELLARHLDSEPGRIRYVHNAFGKPALDPEFGGRLRFNLSHSGGLALIAIAADAELGVDLELIRTEPDLAEIARRFFSPAEAEQLRSLPDPLRAEAFLSCWTQKEACLKACGGGLAFALDLRVASSELAAARHWSLYPLRPAAGFVGALAIEGAGWR